uniref:Uncharacterized protein n=1 Tax=Tanacetum cinerariifolium TaxID=118510 RepID=A0A699KUG1_TANCI|nr:hypothetical protein [Tanacetum cinerariifolium]
MLKISLKEAESNEEIFFFVAWVRDFNIQEPIYPKLYCEFYATYEFDEVCADDELQSKKIISFRLGERVLRSDENFNAREYWERISTDGDLHLSRSSITSVRFLILKVLHKMITYRLCTGYEKTQKNDLWKSRVLIEEIVRTLSTPVYYRSLDRTTLRKLIDSEDRLIPDILVDDVSRVATQRALRVQRALMQNLYERDYNPPGYAQPQYDQYYQQYYPQQPPQYQRDDEENE